MSENKILAAIPPTTPALNELPPKDRAIVAQTIDEILNAENGLALIEQRLNELDPAAGPLFPVLQILFPSLGRFLLGIDYLRTGAFSEARDQLKEGVEGFDKIGETEMRDVGIGFAMYAEAALDVRKGNLARAQEQIGNVREYLRKAGKFGQAFEGMIDHMAPDHFVMQAVNALSNKDFGMGKALIEQAAAASERVARKYYKEDTSEYSTFMGLARYYKAFYQIHRALTSFSELNYDGLANEIDLTRDAIAARDLLSNSDPNLPLVRNAFFVSEGIIEVLELIKELAPTMQKIFNSTFKPDPGIYESFRQKIRKANDSFGQTGDSAATLIRFCDQLSNEVNNIERLAKPQPSEGPIAIPTNKEKLAEETYKTIRDATLQSLNEPLAQLTRWSTLTLVLVALSVLLILTGAASALFLDTKVSVLTSISSIFSSLISSVLFFQLRQARREVKESRTELLKQLEGARQAVFT
jgi:hypothetical protein